MITHITKAKRESSLYIRPERSVWVLDALSCYLSLIFKNPLIQMGEKNIVDQNVGGGGAPAVPTRSTTNYNDRNQS